MSLVTGIATLDRSPGQRLTGANGDHLGTLIAIADDPDDPTQGWGEVAVSGSHGVHRVVPLAAARPTAGGNPWIPYTKAQLVAGPATPPVTDLTDAHRHELLAHYQEPATAPGRIDDPPPDILIPFGLLHTAVPPDDIATTEEWNARVLAARIALAAADPDLPPRRPRSEPPPTAAEGTAEPHAERVRAGHLLRAATLMVVAAAVSVAALTGWRTIRRATRPPL